MALFGKPPRYPECNSGLRHVARDYSTVTTIRTEICALLGFYVAQNGTLLPPFGGQPIGNKPFYYAQKPEIEQILFKLRPKPEITAPMRIV
jgi:hypothetical protein